RTPHPPHPTARHAGPPTGSTRPRPRGPPLLEPARSFRCREPGRREFPETSSVTWPRLARRIGFPPTRARCHLTLSSLEWPNDATGEDFRMLNRPSCAPTASILLRPDLLTGRCLSQARISWTTCPCTSVIRRSIPLCRNVSRV